MVSGDLFHGLLLYIFFQAKASLKDVWNLKACLPTRFHPLDPASYHIRCPDMATLDPGNNLSEDFTARA